MLTGCDALITSNSKSTLTDTFPRFIHHNNQFQVLGTQHQLLV